LAKPTPSIGILLSLTLGLVPILSVVWPPLNAADAASTRPHLYAWGANSSGQLGNGSRTRTSQPQRLALRGVVRVGGGIDFSVALTSSGQVWAWGNQSHGQLGNGKVAQKNQKTPRRVRRLPAIKSLAVGWFHVLALSRSGSVYAWGDDSSGQLGDGNHSLPSCLCRPNPVRVPHLSRVVAIAAGDGFSLALEQNGTVLAWGVNTSGQIGQDSSIIQATSPMRVSGLPRIKALAAGESHSLALSAGHAVWAWGSDYLGQLGDGTYCGYYHCFQTHPVVVTGLSRVAQIAAGGNDSGAITRSRQLWMWGDNGAGELGTGLACGSNYLGCSENVPQLVSAIPSARMVSIGTDHVLGVGADGKLLGWGDNLIGQLGRDAPNQTDVPLPVLGLPAVSTVIGAANYFSLAVARPH